MQSNSAIHELSQFLSLSGVPLPYVQSDNGDRHVCRGLDERVKHLSQQETVFDRATGGIVKDDGQVLQRASFQMT